MRRHDNHEPGFSRVGIAFLRKQFCESAWRDISRIPRSRESPRRIEIQVGVRGRSATDFLTSRSNYERGRSREFARRPRRVARHKRRFDMIQKSPGLGSGIKAKRTGLK